MIRKQALLAACTVMLIACSKTDAPSAQTQAPQNDTPSTPTVQQKEQKINGPFGLKMGLTRAQVKKIVGNLETKTESPNWSSTGTVPVPHPDFESYSLNFSEKSGLCVVAGIGKYIQSGSTGSDIRSKFDVLDEALTSKYGTGKKYDFGSKRPDSPEFWMLHMLQKNRALAKVWNKESKATLNNNISSILVQANVRDINTGYINVRYEFENLEDCSREEKAKTNEGL